MFFVLFLFVLILHIKIVICKYNILFVVADDLRPEIGGMYGQNNIITTPNFDKFMKSAFTFTHAYTQQSLCAPTRASFLTGTRPDTTRVWSIGPYFRDRMINNTGQTVITLPQYFKDNGYYTVGAGKIFHPGSPSGGSGTCDTGNDEPYSWSEKYYDCNQDASGLIDSPAQDGCAAPNNTGCTQTDDCINCFIDWDCIWNTTKKRVVCPSNCDDTCYADWDTVNQTLYNFQRLNELKKNGDDTPWFIATGFKKPHLGFYAPMAYYQMYGYSINYTNISIADNRKSPYNMPKWATNNSTHIAEWHDVQPYLYTENYTSEYNNNTFVIQYINDTYQYYLRAAYYASVSWIDSQFGRLIDGLHEYNLWNNTIIVFTGDHGYHLGEQGCWSKFTNFEVSLRVPLIIRYPNLNEGKSSNILVEQLDMFPTIIDMSDIGFSENITKQLEGKSLFGIIKNPNIEPDFPNVAYSQYPRGGQSPDYTLMGISMRTTNWRYTEWLGWYPGDNFTKPYPLWNETFGKELYNHSKSINDNDFSSYDNYNLAYEDDDNIKAIVKKLHDQLYQTWDNQSWSINYNFK